MREHFPELNEYRVARLGASDVLVNRRRDGSVEAHFLLDNVPEAGILFDRDVSQPLVARKKRFQLSNTAQSELLDGWIGAQAESRLIPLATSGPETRCRSEVHGVTPDN